MKTLKLFLSILVLFCVNYLQAQNITYDWIYATGGFHEEIVNKILVDDDNNVILMGTFFGTIIRDQDTLTSNGYRDIFVMKISSEGDLLWARNAGGKYNEGGNDYFSSDMVLDNLGNIYISTGFEDTLIFNQDTLYSLYNNTCLLKFDADGNTIWAKRLKEDTWNYSRYRRITIDKNNQIYLASNFYESLHIDTLSWTGRSLFLTKFNESGNLLWLKKYPTNSMSVYFKDLEFDEISNLYFLVSLYGEISFDTLTFSRKGQNDLLFGKIDTSGNIKFVKQEAVEGYNWAYPKALTVTDENTVAITGNFRGVIAFDGVEYPGFSSNLFTAHYDSGGSLLWADVLVGSGAADTYDIMYNSDNQIIVTGYFKEKLLHGNVEIESEGAEDVFTAVYNMNGELLLLDRAGGAFQDYGICLANSPDGENYLAGIYIYQADFDQWSIDGFGNFDVFFTAFSIELSGINENKTVLNKMGINLEQNYPNPFNPLTTISFELPQDQNISIKIFDMTGRVVETLYSGKLLAGNYSFDFDGTAMASGMYVYQLITAEGVYSKKMLLLQ